MGLATAINPNRGPSASRRPRGRPAGPDAELRPFYVLAAFLRYRERRSIPEIAAELQVSEATVKRWVNQARELSGLAGVKLGSLLGDADPAIPARS